MIQTAVDMMPFDAEIRMSNGAAVVGWPLLGESASCPFFFTAHFLTSRNLAVLCCGHF